MLIHDPETVCSMLVHITIHAVMYNHPITSSSSSSNGISPRLSVLAGWNDNADPEIILPSDIIAGC
jgi:hypothetical protein